MKHRLLRCAAFLFCLGTLPALPLLAEPVRFPHFAPVLGTSWQAPAWPQNPRAPGAPQDDPADTQSEPFLPQETPEKSAQLQLPTRYLILDADTGEVLRLTPAEYLLGVTAAEMPASYAPEALKAQAVAAHSYALWQMGVQLSAPDPALKGAFLSTDPARFQAYLSEEDRRELWGDAFDEYEKKLQTAVEEAADLVLTSGGKPVAAAFHALSSGRTEAAADVWGQALPCLVSVESPWDKDSPDQTAEVSFTPEEAAAILSAHLENPVFDEEPGSWITVLTRSEGGAVLKARAAGTDVSGRELREWFGLPSADFSLKWDGELFRFTVRGKGHGVGMSQYGANAMAGLGEDFTAILRHYYPGAELMQVGTDGQ